MNRSRNILQIAAATLAALCILGAPAHVRADFTLTLTEDNDSSTTRTVTVQNDNVVAFAGSVGKDFSVVIAFGSSNSPGGANALVQLGTFSLVNNSTSEHTLQVTASAQGFLSPVSPPPLSLVDTVSGSVGTGTVSGTFQGFGDVTNTSQAGASTAVASELLTFSTSGPSQSFSASGGVGGEFSPAKGNPYSLSIIENLTLSAHATFVGTDGNVQAVMPAPSSVLMLLSSLPILGSGLALRRGKRKEVASTLQA